MTKKDLIQKIKNAFANTEYPGDTLTYNYGVGDEGDELADDFKGLTWSEVPREILIKNRGMTSFFLSESFTYYLPALMIFWLEDPTEADVLETSLLSRLKMPTEDEEQESRKNLQEHFRTNGYDTERIEQIQNLYDYHLKEFQELTSLLTDDQKTCVAHFLEHLNDDPTAIYLRTITNDKMGKDAMLALERYWKQYLSPKS